MLPEPSFPVGPDEFVGRRSEIDDFREALRHGLAAGRTSSSAILGEWGIGKSSLLWKFAEVCSKPTFAMLPVCLSVSGNTHDYLRFAEILLDKFAEALLSHPNMQGRLRTELQDWRFKRAHFSAVGFEHESPRPFLSTGTSLLRHTLKEAWDRFLRPAGLKGAVFLVDDLQTITSISERDLALILRDQFQSFGVEMLNYSICFSAKPDFFAETKALADPAVRFYTKLYLEPFTREETVEYTRSAFDLAPDTSATVAARKALPGPLAAEREGTGPHPPVRESRRRRIHASALHRQIPTRVFRKTRGEGPADPHTKRPLQALPPVIPGVSTKIKMNQSHGRHESHQRQDAAASLPPRPGSPLQ